MCLNSNVWFYTNIPEGMLLVDQMSLSINKINIARSSLSQSTEQTKRNSGLLIQDKNKSPSVLLLSLATRKSNTVKGWPAKPYYRALCVCGDLSDFACNPRGRSEGGGGSSRSAHSGRLPRHCSSTPRSSLLAVFLWIHLADGLPAYCQKQTEYFVR